MVPFRRWTFDVAAAVGSAVACGFAAQESGRPYWLQCVAVAAVALPVLVQGRRPLIAAVTALVASGVLLAGGIVPSYASAVLCGPVALTGYRAAAELRPRHSVPVLTLGLAAAAGLAVRWPVAPLVAAPVVAVPWLAGATVRHRRRVAERVAAERTARAVAEERLRIARDVHDTVAHSLSMIAMKASVALHVAEVRPEESTTALRVIETASRDALVEMRRAVGLLRADEEPAKPSGSDGDLHELASYARHSGIEVELVRTGRAAVPAEVRLAVYRIVQEALTNVVRHARATRCVVTIDAGEEAVAVEVLDDGTAAGAVPETAGYGLRGMRERVTAYGGSVHAGPHTAGGFAVAARLPYRSPRAETAW